MAAFEGAADEIFSQPIAAIAVQDLGGARVLALTRKPNGHYGAGSLLGARSKLVPSFAEG